MVEKTRKYNMFVDKKHLKTSISDKASGVESQHPIQILNVILLAN